MKKRMMGYVLLFPPALAIARQAPEGTLIMVAVFAGVVGIILVLEGFADSIGI